MKYLLEPNHSSQKSFYGKAVVFETKNKNVTDKKLFSYETEVARVTIIPPYKTYEHYGRYSATTSKHQKEFFLQEGLTEKEYEYLKKVRKMKVGVSKC